MHSVRQSPDLSARTVGANLMAVLLPFGAVLLLYLAVRDPVISGLYNQTMPLDALNHVIESPTIPLEEYLRNVDLLFGQWFFVLGLVMFLATLLILPSVRSRCGKAPLVLVMCLYAVYATAFIYRTSFVLSGERYFCLFDDAMISMRYARNCAAGHGLVWNPGGERVEGFTNPLWTVYMAALHLLPIPASKVSLAVQISGALSVLGMLPIVGEICRLLAGGKTKASPVAALLVAFYLPLNTWTLQGMEVGFLALVTCWVVMREMRALRTCRPSGSATYAILAVSTAVRLDMAVVFVAVLLFRAWVAKRRVREILAGGGVLLLALGLQTLARYLYYGEFLPNTYYLKMTGYPVLLRWTRGGLVFFDLLMHISLPVVAIFLSAVFFLRGKMLGMLLCVVSAQVAYSVYVGGDAWEWYGGANRFLCVVMPLALAVYSVCVVRLLHLVIQGSATEESRRVRRARSVMLGVLAVFSLLQLNSLKGAKSLNAWALIWDALHAEHNAWSVRKALDIREVTSDSARVATFLAGAAPYFAERHTYDMLGKMDKYIARLPMHIEVESGSMRLVAFYPGHRKWDYDYTIKEKQPDVVTGLYTPGYRMCPPYVYDGARGLYLLSGSTNINWSLVALE